MFKYFSQYLHRLKHDFLFKLVNPVVYMINPIVFKAEMLLISSLTPKQDTNKEISHERSSKSIHGVIVTAIFPLFSKALSSPFHQSLLGLRYFYPLTAKSDQDRISPKISTLYLTSDENKEKMLIRGSSVDPVLYSPN